MGVPPIRESGVISAYARHATTMAPTMSSGISHPQMRARAPKPLPRRRTECAQAPRETEATLHWA